MPNTKHNITMCKNVQKKKNKRVTYACIRYITNFKQQKVKKCIHEGWLTQNNVKIKYILVFSFYQLLFFLHSDYLNVFFARTIIYNK